VIWTARPKNAAVRPPSAVFYGRTAGCNRGRRAHFCTPFARGRSIKGLLRGTRVVAFLCAPGTGALLRVQVPP
jgi:hypothetical protein